MTIKHLLLPLVTLILIFALPGNTTAQVTCGVTPFTVTATYSDVTCFGMNDGTVSVGVTGGVGPFTYSWDNGLGSGQSHFGLGPSTYTVTVTDVGQGSTTCNDAVTVSEPADIIVTPTVVDANCGMADGQICVVVSGGSPPYTHDIGGSPQASNCFNGLFAGSYTVTVTDGNGCQGSAIAVVQDISGVVASISSQTDVSCFGACDGTATASPIGGPAPYTYMWDANTGNQVTATAISLCTGTYQVTITDANGCSSIANAVIGGPSQINPNATSTDVTCNGICDGSASVSVVGGTPPYTYLWWSGQTTAAVTGLCAGSYQVLVTDDNGCVTDTTVVINEPAAISATVTGNDITCFGTCDGTINLTAVTGGTPGYTYSWYDAGGTPIGQSAPTAVNLCAGDFYAIVTDNNGCTWISPIVTVNEPVELTITYGYTDVSCNGFCDGDATVFPIGGTGAYTYLWNNPGVFTTQTANGLCAGTYECIVTDANGCTNSPQVVVVSEPPAVGATVNSTSPSCFGSCDGSATAAAFGGMSPYTYQWLDGSGATISTGTIVNGLCPDTYTLNITDAAGCFYSTIVSIVAPPAITVASTVTDVSTCGGSDGQISITAGGGTPGYQFSIDNGATFQAGNTFTGLPVGTYSVIVEDANGCQGFDSPIVQDPGLDDASFNYAPTTYCQNATNPVPTITGLAGGTFSSGTLLVNPTTGEIDLAGSPIGTQQVTYTTNGPCPNSENFDVTIVPIDDPSFAFASGTYCTGTGCAMPTLTGTPGGTWTINNGGTINSSTGCIDLVATAPGAYDVTYTTAGLCPDLMVVSITLVLPANAGFTLPVGPLCPSGFAIPSLVGGAVSGTWTAQPAGLDINAVSGQIDLGNSLPNVYMVYNTLAATAGCNAIVDSLSLEVAPEVLFTTATAGSSCNTSCDGFIQFTVTSGTGPFLFSIDNGATFQAASLFSNLCAGTYDLVVMDANGCMSSGQEILTAPTPLSISVTSSQPSCSQCDGTLEASVTGGTPVYNYLWSPAANLNNPTVYNPGVCGSLSPTMYYITITDMNGCVAVDSILITAQCDSVYPGDTNYDNIADNNDLLPIGLAYGTTGPVRPSATLVWSGQISPNWADTLTGAVNYKHIDTNGDGVIDDNDTTAIIQNYGMAHAIHQWKPRGGAADPDLYFTLTSDTLQPNTPFTADLELGTPSTPADNVYGLAYTVWFNEETLDSASGVQMDFSNSWIGTEGTDMITIQHLMWQQGRLDVAMVRIDGNTVSGWGPIGSCHAVTTDNLSGKSNKATVSETLTLDLSHVTIINELGEDIPVNVYADSVVVIDTATSIAVTPNWHYEVNIFPVPSKDKLTITTGSYTADRIAMYNAVGDAVYVIESINDTRLNIDLASWPNGVYFLEVEVAGQRVNRRIVVSH